MPGPFEFERFGEPQYFLPEGHEPRQPVPLDGPSWLDRYRDLYAGLELCAFPDLSQGRWLSDPQVKESIRSTMENLKRSNAGSAWRHLSERGKRELRMALKGLRDQFGFPSCRARAEAYYCGLLAVWDAREGWTGQRYDPEHAMPLCEALMKHKGRPDFYYRSFQLITGKPYSSLCWDLYFGASWCRKYGPEAYRRHRATPLRRRAGRRKGPFQDQDLQSQNALSSPAPSDRASDPQTEAEIEKLIHLLHQGVQLEAALAEVDLSDALASILMDPANAEMVAAWVARQRSD
jgi:hypothetical protein